MGVATIIYCWFPNQNCSSIGEEEEEKKRNLVWDVATNFPIAILLHNTAYLANEKPLNFQFGQFTFVGYFDLLVQDIVRLENTLQLVKIRTPLLWTYPESIPLSNIFGLVAIL